MGQTHQSLGNFNEALKSKREALEIAIRRDEFLLSADIQYDIGEILILIAQYDEARTFLSQSISTYCSLGAASQEANARKIMNNMGH